MKLTKKILEQMIKEEHKKVCLDLIYDNKEKWMQIMRNSIETSIQYTADRMIKEYQEKYYQNHHQELFSVIK